MSFKDKTLVLKLREAKKKFKFSEVQDYNRKSLGYFAWRKEVLRLGGYKCRYCESKKRLKVVRVSSLGEVVCAKCKGKMRTTQKLKRLMKQEMDQLINQVNT